MPNIRSLKSELPGGREVLLGWNTDDAADPAYYVRFKNEEGEETKFRLSPEALDTLIELKPSVDLYRRTGSLFEWRMVEPEAQEPAPQGA